MIILYSGIGAKKNGIHTEQEFLDIMNKTTTWKDWNNSVSWPEQLQFKDWVLPDDFIFFTLKINLKGNVLTLLLSEFKREQKNSLKNGFQTA